MLDKKRISLGESNLAVSKEEKLKVVLDSNFLFVPSQFHLDIFEELANLLNQRFEPILLSSTQKELQGLAESTSPNFLSLLLSSRSFVATGDFHSAATLTITSS